MRQLILSVTCLLLIGVCAKERRCHVQGTCDGHIDIQNRWSLQGHRLRLRRFTAQDGQHVQGTPTQMALTPLRNLDSRQQAAADLRCISH